MQAVLEYGKSAQHSIRDFVSHSKQAPATRDGRLTSPFSAGEKNGSPAKPELPSSAMPDQPYWRAKSCMKLTSDFTPSIGIAL